MNNPSIPGFLVYTHIFRWEPNTAKASNASMPESVASAPGYVGQGDIRTMVRHLIEFVAHHGPALESIRINPTWLRHDEEEKRKPRRRKIWVHGTPPPPTGWDLIEKYNFLGDLNIPQVLLDPCLSPNVVIASIADVVPRYVLGIIEHSPDPIVTSNGTEVYCPRCGLAGANWEYDIPTMTWKGQFKCLNQLCDYQHYPVKKMTTQEQEALINLPLGTPRGSVTHPVPENVAGALEDIRRRSLSPVTRAESEETDDDGEEKGPGRIDINNSERFADIVRGRLAANQELHTPEERRRGAHDPLAQVLFDVERRADSEQERKRIQDISSSYLNGRIDGAAVQRALQRIAREPKPTRRDRRR